MEGWFFFLFLVWWGPRGRNVPKNWVTRPSSAQKQNFNLYILYSTLFMASWPSSARKQNFNLEGWSFVSGLMKATRPKHSQELSEQVFINPETKFKHLHLIQYLVFGLVVFIGPETNFSLEGWSFVSGMMKATRPKRSQELSEEAFQPRNKASTPISDIVLRFWPRGLHQPGN